MQPTTGELFNVRFKVTRLTLFFGAATAFVLAYVFIPHEYRHVLVFAGASTGAAAALHNAYLARKTFEVQVRDKKLSIASEFYEKFYGPGFTATRRDFLALEKEFRDKKAKEIVEELFENDEKARVVYEVLNLWEQVGYSVRQKRTDQAMICNLMGTAYMRSYMLVLPWLEEYRRRQKHETAWEHFEWLCKAIQEEKKSKDS